MLSAREFERQLDTLLPSPKMRELINAFVGILENNPELAKQAENALEPMLANKSKATKHKDSALSKPIQQFIRKRFGTLLINPNLALPVLMSLGLFGSANAQSNNGTALTFVNGHGNGPDLCGSALSCIQVAIQQGNITLAVVARKIIYQTLIPDLGVHFTLSPCYNSDDLINMLSSLYGSVTNWTPSTDRETIDGPTWNPSKDVSVYYQLETYGIASDLKPDQTQLNDKAASCQTGLNAWAAGGIDFGFAVAGITAIVCCIVAAYCCYKGICCVEKSVENEVHDLEMQVGRQPRRGTAGLPN